MRRRADINRHATIPQVLRHATIPQCLHNLTGGLDAQEAVFGDDLLSVSEEGVWLPDGVEHFLANDQIFGLGARVHELQPRVAPVLREVHVQREVLSDQTSPTIFVCSCVVDGAVDVLYDEENTSIYSTPCLVVT